MGGAKSVVNNWRKQKEREIQYKNTKKKYMMRFSNKLKLFEKEMNFKMGIKNKNHKINEMIQSIILIL